MRLGPKKRGRRAFPTDDELRGSRDYLFGLFDAVWAELAPKLESLAEIGDVPNALTALANEDRDYAIRILLRTTLTPATPKELRAMKRQLDQTKDSIDAAVRSSKDTYNRLQVIQRLLSQKPTKYERASLLADERTTTKQLRQERRRQNGLNRRSKHLAETLENGRAYFARLELVKYCQSDRSRLTPRRAANAIAGFPFIGWRRSAQRCVKLETDKRIGGYRYQVIVVFRRIIKSWNEDKNLVARAKRYLQNRRPTPSHVFSELKKNWRYVRLSILEALKTKTPRGRLHFAIASEYFRVTLMPKSESEAYWAQKEQLVSGKIKKRQ